jgi:hypothetical protein
LVGDIGACPRKRKKHVYVVLKLSRTYEIISL